jgi:hypothetical protein
VAQASETMEAKRFASLPKRVTIRRLFQPSEHALNDIALSVLGSVKQSGHFSSEEGE